MAVYGIWAGVKGWFVKDRVKLAQEALAKGNAAKTLAHLAQLKRSGSFNINIARMIVLQLFKKVVMDKNMAGLQLVLKDEAFTTREDIFRKTLMWAAMELIETRQFDMAHLILIRIEGFDWSFAQKQSARMDMLKRRAELVEKAGTIPITAADIIEELSLCFPASAREAVKAAGWGRDAAKLKKLDQQYSGEEEPQGASDTIKVNGLPAIATNATVVLTKKALKAVVDRAIEQEATIAYSANPTVVAMPARGENDATVVMPEDPDPTIKE